jgi:hypothetical protein
VLAGVVVLAFCAEAVSVPLRVLVLLLVLGAAVLLGDCFGVVCALVAADRITKATNGRKNFFIIVVFYF